MTIIELAQMILEREKREMHYGGFKAGLYALKKKRPVAHPTPPIDIDTNPEPEPPLDTTFIGKAGEYGVFSELLYWRYNPAMMVVDHGIDIVASKDGEYFHIQVKTSNQRANNKFNFKINRDIFKVHDNSKTFYVFVVRRNTKNRPLSDYIIMQSSHIRFLIESNVITSEKDISLTISFETVFIR